MTLAEFTERVIQCVRYRIQIRNHTMSTETRTIRTIGVNNAFKCFFSYYNFLKLFTYHRCQTWASTRYTTTVFARLLFYLRYERRSAKRTLRNAAFIHK